MRKRDKRRKRKFAGMVLFFAAMFFGFMVRIVKAVLGAVWGLIKFSPRAVLYAVIIFVAIGYGNMIVLALVSVLIVLYELFRRGWVKA